MKGLSLSCLSYDCVCCGGDAHACVTCGVAAAAVTAEMTDPAQASDLEAVQALLDAAALAAAAAVTDAGLAEDLTPKAVLHQQHPALNAFAAGAVQFAAPVMEHVCCGVCWMGHH